MLWQRSVVVAGLAAVLAAPLAAAEPEGVQKVTEIEGISEYRLDNGMRVLLFPDSSRATVTVNMTVFVGSRHEGYGEAGMAHLLEHMLFKGTPDHPNIPQALQARGAQFNGTTWVDRTNYYETLPANDENLEFAIRLEADRLVNSTIRQEDLDSEMTVVRNEFEQGENSPYYVLSQRLLSAAYDWHNYGQATIGNRADIERVPIENLRKFYRRYYQPDNVMLVVAGRFDPDKALEYVAKHFGPIPRPDREIHKTWTEEPPQDGEATVRGAWTLHDAAGHWITGSDHPASIPEHDGERVVVLDPLTMHTRWSAGRAFPMVHAHLEVLAELPAEEARLRLDRAAPPRDP
jgi:zinc protease